jgi:hypothetical protein
VLLKSPFNQIEMKFYFRFVQTLVDSDKARREVIMHKKACENCPYIVQILDIYVRIFVGFFPRLSNSIPGKYAWIGSMFFDCNGTVLHFPIG